MTETSEAARQVREALTMLRSDILRWTEPPKLSRVLSAGINVAIKMLDADDFDGAHAVLVCLKAQVEAAGASAYTRGVE